MTIFYILDRDGDLFPGPGGGPGRGVVGQADEDNDGRLSGYEFNQAEVMQIEWADTDGSKTATPAELQAYRASLAGH